MQAFRSEGEIDRWCQRHGRERGAVFEPERLWRLAQRWYDDRLDLDWRRRSVPARQRILTELGLVGDFWQI